MTLYTTRDGCRIHYEISGEGRQVALTPGGRESGQMLAPLIAELSSHCSVLTWDRRNTGQSDVYFDPSRSESEIWADDLAELLQAIGFYPAIIGGGSAGCRVSLNAVLRHPAIADALILWSPSGGAYGSQFLGFSYHVPYIMAAQRGGMAAVAETPFFAERIKANPANRERLLALDPATFIETMRRWNESFYVRADSAIAGVAGDLASIAVPTLMFDSDDDIHPHEAAETIAVKIPNAVLTPSAWTRDEWMGRFTGKVPGSSADLYPLLVPRMLEFIAQSA